MSVYIHSGRWTSIWRKKKASTAFSTNSLATLVAGYVEPASTDAGAADKPVLGIYEGPAITSASSDYAATTEIMVKVPIGPALARMTCSIAATDEGKGLDMADAVSVHASNNTYSPVTLVRYLSATEGLFAIAKSVYATVA